MTRDSRPPPGALRLHSVFDTWWPLAASWLLMGLELPMVSAVMARLPHATVSLAAYGGVVSPLAMLFEGPIIMLLSASVALSRDWPSYRLVRRVMLAAGGTLTALHALVAFSPLYDVVAGRWLGVPAPVLEPARLGLRIMTPWTLSIAYRRTQQGVLIRFGHARAVGVGTMVRLGANAVVLAAGYAVHAAPGIVVGTLAVAAGVVSEAVYAGLRVHPLLRGQLRSAPPLPEPLTLRAFLRFYAPLAVTPFIAFLATPVASAAMSRMPRPVESLAAWPVLNGLVFTLRSVGFAFNEVVVALLDRPGAVSALRGFARRLAGAMTGLLVVVAATPLGHLWFAGVSALPAPLVALASVALWLSLVMPALSVAQSWFQGAIVHSRRTRAVTESVFVYLGGITLLLGAGVAWGRAPGLPAAALATSAGGIAQVAWLWCRSRAVLRAREARDHQLLAGAVRG